MLNNSLKKTHYNRDELILCGQGKLFGTDNARLPLPPMLMFDRITRIDTQAGHYGKGQIMAEMTIHPDLWFFKCHFQDDPVMPGCLGVDAVWQLLGFYLAWLGYPGKGRALGSGEIKFSGQVQPDAHCITYQVDISRLIQRKLVMGIADAKVFLDGDLIYSMQNLKVGLFSI